LHNHVANVHAHAEFNAVIFRDAGVSFTDTTLHLGGARDRVHDARKFHQHAVAGQFDNAPLMLADFRVNEIAPQLV